MDNRIHSEPRYENVLEKIAPTQIERQRLLKRFFEPQRGPDESESAATIEPTTAHESIARLVKLGAIKVIVTMNFDHLLEQAIRAQGVEPTVVVTDSDIRGLAPLHTLDCCLLHLHGDYMHPESMLNTTAELQEYTEIVHDKLCEVIEQHGLIVSGWSAKYDPALRDAIKSHYTRRFTMLWVEPADELTDEAAQLVQLKGAVRLQATAEDGFGRLADAVESMQTRRARHPLTTTTAAETAKRELSGRWTAIRLHDALRAEYERLYANFHLPHHNNAKEFGGYESLVARTEEAVKVPATLVAALPYWGDEDTDKWWIEEILRFAVHARLSGSS